MKIVKKVILKQDYYKYNLNNFFSIESLKSNIEKEDINIDLLNAAIFYYTNNERNKNKIPLCEFHPVLRDSSIIHSAQMKLHDFFSHENHYNPTYKTPLDRVNSIKTGKNLKFSSIAENISDSPILKTEGKKFIVKSILDTKRYYSIDGLKEIHPFTYKEFASEIVKGWMNSHGHRLNILNPQFKYLGCGAVMYEKKNNNLLPSILHFKVTQNFGGELLNTQAEQTTKNKIKIVKKQ